jgi:uncharacterized protein (DUF58 family)
MPTRLGWALLLLLAGIGFAAVNTGNNLLYLLLGVGLAAMAVSSVAGGRALRRIDAEVTYPEEILASDPTAFILTVRNRDRRWASPAVRARLWSGTVSLPEVALAPLPPSGSATRFVPARFPRRGLYPAGRLTLETTGPYGLTRRRRRVRPGGEFFVYPAPHALDEVEPLEGRPDRGDRAARRVGEGLELRQIRPYEFEDDSRHIDWRATARLDDLMVKEFLEEGAEQVVIAFDPAVDRDDEPTRRRFEREVSVAAALVLRCGARRLPFRFLAPGREFHAVDPPGGHRPVLEYLATVQPVASPGAPPFGADLLGTPGLVRLGVRA